MEKKYKFYFVVSENLNHRKEEVNKAGGLWTGFGYMFPFICKLLEDISKEVGKQIREYSTNETFQEMEKGFKLANLEEMSIKEGRTDKRKEDLIKAKENELRFSKEALEEMNKRWAFVEYPVSIVDLGENTKNNKPKEGEEQLKHYNKTDFLSLHQNDRFEDKNKGNWWLSNPGRRSFDSIDFDTRKPPFQYEEKGNKNINLWQGLAIEPIEGDCSIILSHMKEVICAGHEDYYDYLMKLFATWVQKPWEKTLCPVLRSPQGTGKKVLPVLFNHIFGHAFLSTSDHKSVFGNFNAAIEYKILIELNEAMFGGDKHLSGQMKSYITDDTIVITRKGKDPYLTNNQKKFFITSNESFAIPVDREARRFLFLDVSSKRMGDKKYFSELYDLIEKGEGSPAFLAHLLDIDLEGFDFRNLPKWATGAGFTNKLESSDSFLRYLYDALYEGYLDVEGDTGGQGNYWCDDGYHSYVLQGCYRTYVRARGKMREVSNEKIGRVISAVFGKCKVRVREGERLYWKYEFGSLKEARVKFARYFNCEDGDVFGEC